MEISEKAVELEQAREAVWVHAVHPVVMAGLLGIFCASGFVASSLFNQQRFLLKAAPRFSPGIFSWSIPFYPGWVWIYVLYYPFCFLPLFLEPVRKNRSVFLRTLMGYALQFGICFVFFFFWPIRMIHGELRPGLSTHLIGYIQSFDGGFNAFPSLHVANTVFVAQLFLRFHRPWAGRALLAGAFLIALSALFIQQHYVYDVLAGALLGWICFQVSWFRRDSALDASISPKRFSRGS